MSLRVIKTVPNDEYFHLFDEVKHHVYESTSIVFRQNDDLNTEFLDHCLVVLDSDIPVARLAVYNNPELYYMSQKACCIGNFESLQLTNIVKLLISEVTTWAKEQGFKYIIGPMNGSTWDNYRFSAHRNNPLFLSEPFHHLYYNDLFKTSGFDVILNYQSRIERNISADNAKVAQKIEESALNGFTIREFDANNLETELENLYPLATGAFERNQLYTSISKETFFKKYAGIIKQLGTRYVLLAEKNNEIIAFVFAFQNLLEQNRKQIVYKTIARKYGKEYAGIGHVVALEVMKRALEDGMQDAIHAFMIYDATSTEISNNFNSQPYSEYALYAKKLDNE